MSLLAVAAAVVAASVGVSAGSWLITWRCLLRSTLSWTQSGFPGEFVESRPLRMQPCWFGRAAISPDAWPWNAVAFRHARNGTRTCGWQRHASPTRHPSDVCREEGGIFRFSLPLQDLVNVDLQPEVYIRYGLVLLRAWLCVWLALPCVWLALLCRLERPCWLALLCARL